MAKYPCGVCGTNVRSSAILCTDLCNTWLHFKCAGLSLSAVRNMEKEDFLGEWKRLKCKPNLSTKSKEHAIDLTAEGNEGNYSDQINCSSIAEEIHLSVLKENEGLEKNI